MRLYQCYFNYKVDDGTLVKNYNISCWLGITQQYLRYKKDYSHFLTEDEIKTIGNRFIYLTVLNNNNTSNDWSFYKSMKDCIIEHDIIYIEQFTFPKTSHNIPLLLSLINKITPCEIVKINDVEYIRYKLIKTYDQNLILLNFIRNLWNAEIKGYNELFFMYLKEGSSYQDPLEILTDANKKACVNICTKYSPGHSNIHLANELKIKNTKQLLGYKGLTTEKFLTT